MVLAQDSIAEDSELLKVLLIGVLSRSRYGVEAIIEIAKIYLVILEAYLQNLIL